MKVNEVLRMAESQSLTVRLLTETNGKKPVYYVRSTCQRHVALLLRLQIYCQREPRESSTKAFLFFYL
jgi:hypothetical protein